MMKKILSLFLLIGLNVFAADNLIQDPCFESGPKPWFQERGKGAYYIEHEKIADAYEGNQVLVVKGWREAGSRILSPVIPVRSGKASLTMAIRLFGKTPVNVTVALFSDHTNAEIATFGKWEIQPNEGWRHLSVEGVEIPQTEKPLRLGIFIEGKNARLEIDSMGLFQGDKVFPVRNNVETYTWKAIQFANGSGWKAINQPRVADVFLSEKSLSGSYATGNRGNNEGVTHANIAQPGKHRFWVRFLHSNLTEEFTIGIRQNGVDIAKKTIAVNDASYGLKGIHWVWDSVMGELAAGEVEVFISHPSQPSEKALGRMLDFALLTNLTDWQPSHSDFLPFGFMRFVNESENQEPFCFFVTLRRPMYRAHQWFSMPGILSHAGFSGLRGVSNDQTQWLAAGETSPWVRIHDDLLPGEKGQDGHNRVQLIATRINHNSGLVTGRIKGRLEFATGADRKIVRSIPIDQDGARVLLTLPYDFESKPEEILSARDHVERAENALPKEADEIPHFKNIELMANFDLVLPLDDSDLIRREISLLRRLGFNNVQGSLAPPPEAEKFRQELGLAPSMIMTVVNPMSFIKEKCQNSPDVSGMEARVRQSSEINAPILESIIWNMMDDEPKSMSYEHIAKCQACLEKFRISLKSKNLNPRDLGVSSWDEVRPVTKEDRYRLPFLYYHTGLFRLQSMADLFKLANEITHKYYPKSTLGTANLSPVGNSGTWTDGTGNESGVDPFMFLRNGTTDFMWTEDWGGYGASLQQNASLLGMFRSAGRIDGKSLGGYCVIVNANPKEALGLRIKTMQWLAAGANLINFYNYGPAYSQIGTWGENYPLYSLLSETGKQISVIDSVLNGMQRKPASVAVLYNRTAGIWADFASNTEQDARYIYWALEHAGHHVDFIPEEDIDAGLLSSYKVLYINGVQLKQQTALKIAEWTKKGGVLVGTAGAGTRDEFNRPMNALNKVFGLKGNNLELKTNAGRPLYETRTMPVIDRMVGDEIKFNRLGILEKILPEANATVFLKSENGDATGIFQKYGNGTAIRMAVLPGISYVNEAIRIWDYEPRMLPRNYRKELRDFIAWPTRLAKVAAIAEMSSTKATASRWDSPENSILYIIDYSGEALTKFTMTIPDDGNFSEAYSSRGLPVQFSKTNDGNIHLIFDLEGADAIILKRNKP